MMILDQLQRIESNNMSHVLAQYLINDSSMCFSLWHDQSNNGNEPPTLFNWWDMMQLLRSKALLQ